MIPIYQTIFDNKRGNCLAAIWASLLHLNLNEVPNFVEQEDYFGALCDFIRPLGYEYERYLVNPNRRDLSEESMSNYDFLHKGLPLCYSIGGYFDATVYSPNYFEADRFLNDPDYTPVCHAVIVDKDLNIVHDPNPSYKNIKGYPTSETIGFNGVIGISLFKKNTQ